MAPPRDIEALALRKLDGLGFDSPRGCLKESDEIAQSLSKDR